MDRQKLCCAVIGLIVGGLVAADEPGSAPPFGDAQAYLEEIIVTATKRETSLRDTALSVGVITGKTLAESGALNIDDYWRTIPSLAVSDQGFGGLRITIRGLGEEPIGVSESMSAVYFDETPVNQADGLFTMSPDFSLVDINRVEVLRGPQGTLFGASAMGGAVRIITNQPDADESYGSVQGILSDTAHGGFNVEANAVWNLPLSDSSAARLVAYHRNRDGFVDDIGLAQDNINSDVVSGARIALSTNVGERLTLTGKLQYQDREAGGFTFVDPNGKPSLGLGTFGDYQVALLSDEFRDETATLFSLTADYSAAWGDWTSISSWTRYDVELKIDLAEEATFVFGDYMPFYSTTNSEQEAFIQELRVAAKPDSAIQWLVGIFYLDQDTPRTDEFFLVNNPLQVNTAGDSREDLGIFGEASWPITERLTGTVGARWFDVRKRGHAVLNGITTGFQDVVTDLAYDEDGVTSKFSLAWDFSDRSMMYVLASQGFRAGGGNTPLAVTLCGAPPSFNSDDLWNFEIGHKSTLLDRRLTLNVSLYTIDWSEAQLALNVPGCNDVYVANVGEASSDGIEIELKALLSDSWELLLSGGFNGSQVDSSPAESDIPAGADIPLVPDVTAAISSTHRFSLMQKYRGLFAADLQYVGSSSSSLFPFFNVKQSSYSLFNLRFGIESDAWQVVLFANNVLDEQATLVCCRIDGGFTTNRPRTVGVRASYDF